MVVSGTYTCGPFDTTGAGLVDLTVQQGRTRGFGSVPILTCDGTTQAFQAEVVSNSDRQVKRGAATATASGYVEAWPAARRSARPPASTTSASPSGAGSPAVAVAG